MKIGPTSSKNTRSTLRGIRRPALGATHLLELAHTGFAERFPPPRATPSCSPETTPVLSCHGFGAGGVRIPGATLFRSGASGAVAESRAAFAFEKAPQPAVRRASGAADDIRTDAGGSLAARFGARQPLLPFPGNLDRLSRAHVSTSALRSAVGRRRRKEGPPAGPPRPSRPASVQRDRPRAASSPHRAPSLPLAG